MSIPNTTNNHSIKWLIIAIIVLCLLIVGSIGFLIGAKSVEPVIQEKIVVEQVPTTPEVCKDFINSSDKMLNYASEIVQIASKTITHLENDDTEALEVDAIRLQEIEDEVRQERINYDNTRLECRQK